MKVVLAGGEQIDLGKVETAPTIGIIDFSRRVTDDFGVTTVVARKFARRMSVRVSLPFDQVDTVRRRLTELRATPAQWVADDRFAWLNFQGFYKGFELDLAVPPLSYCMLTVDSLAESEAGADTGGDPAPSGAKSSLLLLQPVVVGDAMLVASNVPENDHPEWSGATTYALGTRVIRAATHRVYESALAGNVGHDPTAEDGQWLDVGPTNRWALLDQALGTATSRNNGLSLTLAAGAIDAVALLDVIGSTVRVQAPGYDQTIAVGLGPVIFLDLPGGDGQLTVTVSGIGPVSVGTLLVGHLVGLGITGESPTAGINDFSRKETDEFGETTVVPRAWSKRMSASALIRTDAVDLVANRIAAVRARPSLWIGSEGSDTLTIYGFFKDFSIEVGEGVSTLALSVEGFSEATAFAPPSVVGWPDIADTDPVGRPRPEDGATVGAPGNTPVGNRPASTVISQIDASASEIDQLWDTYGDTASAEASAAAAEVSAAAADAAKAAAEQAGAAAAASAAVSQTAASASETARTQSQAARDAAGVARDAAQAAETSAQGAASTATTKASAAGGSATASAGSATTATNQANAASGSASAAAGSATAAQTSAGQASTSAGQSATSATNAAGSASAAATSASTAASARDAAQTSASAAATSASNAGASATTAGQQATASQTSATNAATSAGQASTSAGQAATSATNASGSASSAATSATTAATAGQAANQAAASLLPDVPTSLAMWTTSPAGAPTAVTDATGAIVADADFGSALEASGATANRYHKGVVPCVAGRIYEYRVRAKVTAASAFPATYRALWVALTDAYAQVGSVVLVSSTVAAANAIGEIVTLINCESILSSSPTAKWVRPGFQVSATTTTMRTGMAAIRDVTAREAASGSASAAASSASSAAASNTASSNNASAAQTSATNAATSAGQASTSAGQASTSASQASTSATNAAGSASTAGTQATNAANSATTAGNSASAANTSASQASTSATNAATSATSASGSANTASTKATDASNSASAAATSASGASASQTAAGNSASAAQNARVAAESARDAASASATSASTSASSAATSATTAGNSASAAQTSATNAATSASGASTSASQASTSATNSAGSASAASASQSQAASAASTARTTAANLLPSDFQENGRYWFTSYQGDVLTQTPEAAGFTFPVVDGRKVAQNTTTGTATTAASNATNNLSTIGRVTAVTGRRYKMRVRFRFLTSSAGNAVALWFINNSPDGAYHNGSNGPHTSAPAVNVWTEYSSPELLLTPDWGTIAPFLRFYGPAGAQFQVAWFSLDDVTESSAAANSASAAASSASAASASQTAAGSSATSASTSANTASTQATNAGNSATAAASSSASAASSSSAAGSSAAAAQSNATLVASAALGSINRNPTFMDFPTSGTIPPGYVNGGMPSGLGTRVANPTVVGGYGWQIVSPAGQNQVAYAAIDAALIDALSWWVIECDVRLDAGTFNGSGLQLTGPNTAGNAIVFIQEVPSGGTVGKTYRFRKLVQVPANGYEHHALYMVNHFSAPLYGGIGASNTLTWFRVAARPASSAEIAGGRVPAIEASVTTLASVSAATDGRTQAHWAVSANAGGAVAAIEARAITTPGGAAASGVGIVAEEFSVTNTMAGVRRRAVRMVGGDAYFDGSLSSGTGVFLGSGVKWSYQLKPKDFPVSDGTVVTFGVTFDGAPVVDFSTSGLAPLASGETYQLYAENLTGTGFTARLKIATPGAASAVSLIADTVPGSGPTRQIARGANAESSNGSYTFAAQGTYSGNAYYVETDQYPNDYR